MQYYKKATDVFRWNIVEAILYHGLLLGHQILLFSQVDYRLYGLIGTIFSLIFLAAFLFNSGLDACLGAFFKQLSSSKASFRKLLGVQLLPQLILGITTVLLVYFNFSYLPIGVKTVVSGNPTIFGICFLIIILETMKRVIRPLLQLAFLNKKTTIIELLSMSSYITMVWTGYYLFSTINLFIIFIPLLIISIGSTLALLYYLYHWYTTLPTDSPHAQHQYYSFFKTRFFTFANKMTQIFFSSNMLVPLFALQFGLYQAGILKFISSIAYSFSAIIYKIFGHTSSVLMSDAREMPLKDKRKVFYSITQRLHQVLYGIIIFLVINFKKFSLIPGMSNNNSGWFLAYFLFVVIILENFFITYEHFYIIEKKTSSFFILNSVSMIILYGIISYNTDLSPFLMLLSITICRTITFISVSILSLYLWQIKPVWKMHPRYFIYSLIVSFLFFVLVK